MAGISKNDGKSQLLEDIEAFSRNGPVLRNEPEKPVLTREILAFPDLSKSPPEKSKGGSSTGQSPCPTLEVPSTLGQPSAGSMLARLREQARSVQQVAVLAGIDQEARAQQLSASMGAAFHYLDDLIKQLNIIKPTVPKEFTFPGNILFAGMAWVEGAADFRMLPTATEDRLYESLTVRFRIASAKRIVVERDVLGAEPLRKQLHDLGIQYVMDEKMNARRQLERAIFSFPCEIKSGFVIKADYAAGNLILRTRNIDRFGLMEFRMKPEDLHQETMDELTKLFLGEPSRFLQMFRRSA